MGAELEFRFLVLFLAAINLHRPALLLLIANSAKASLNMKQLKIHQVGCRVLRNKIFLWWRSRRRRNKGTNRENAASLGLSSPTVNYSQMSRELLCDRSRICVWEEQQHLRRLHCNYQMSQKVAPEGGEGREGKAVRPTHGRRIISHIFKF